MVAQEEQVFGLMSFSGGLNNSVPAANIEDEEVYEINNFEIGRKGELFPRPGIQDFLTDINCALIGVYYDSNSTFNAPAFVYVKTTTGTLMDLVVRIDGVETVLATIDYSTVPERNALVHPLALVEYGGKAYLFPKLNGTGMDEIHNTGITTASTIEFYSGISFKDRFFGAEKNSNRLYFSEVADFTDFPGVNFIDVTGVDTTGIVGFGVVSDVLYIFKKNSVWALYVQGDPSNWTLRQITDTVGAVTFRGICSYEGNIYFASERTIYQTDGLDFTDIGYKWTDSYIGRSSDNTKFFYDFGTSPGVEIVAVEGRIVVTTGAAMYIFYPDKEIWSVWTAGGEFQYLTPVRSTVDSPTRPSSFLAYFDPTVDKSKFVSRDNDYDVATGECSVRTKQYDCGVPTFVKRGKKLFIEYCGIFSDAVSVDIHIDVSPKPAIGDTFVLEDQPVSSTDFMIASMETFFRRFGISISNVFPEAAGLRPEEDPTILGIFVPYSVQSRFIGHTD